MLLFNSITRADDCFYWTLNVLLRSVSCALRTPNVQNEKVKVCLVIFVHAIQGESAITQHWHENTNLAQSITDKSGFLVYCEESAFSAEDFLV